MAESIPHPFQYQTTACVMSDTWLFTTFHSQSRYHWMVWLKNSLHIIMPQYVPYCSFSGVWYFWHSLQHGFGHTKQKCSETVVVSSVGFYVLEVKQTNKFFCGWNICSTANHQVAQSGTELLAAEWWGGPRAHPFLSSCWRSKRCTPGILFSFCDCNDSHGLYGLPRYSS